MKFLLLICFVSLSLMLSSCSTNSRKLTGKRFTSEEMIPESLKDQSDIRLGEEYSGELSKKSAMLCNPECAAFNLYGFEPSNTKTYKIDIYTPKNRFSSKMLALDFALKTNSKDKHIEPKHIYSRKVNWKTLQKTFYFKLNKGEKYSLIFKHDRKLRDKIVMYGLHPQDKIMGSKFGSYKFKISKFDKDDLNIVLANQHIRLKSLIGWKIEYKDDIQKNVKMMESYTPKSLHQAVDNRMDGYVLRISKEEDHYRKNVNLFSSNSIIVSAMPSYILKDYTLEQRANFFIDLNTRSLLNLFKTAKFNVLENPQEKIFHEKKSIYYKYGIKLAKEVKTIIVESYLVEHKEKTLMITVQHIKQDGDDNGISQMKEIVNSVQFI